MIENDLALSDLHILDLTRAAAGPACALILEKTVRDPCLRAWDDLNGR